MNSELQSLQQQVERLTQQYQALSSEHIRSQQQYRQATRRLRVQGALAFCAVVGAILLFPASRAAIAQGYGVTLQQLATRLSVVETKTQFMSADATAKSTTFSGCNLYINNGLGATDGNPSDPFDLFQNKDIVNGLGNLIIGYNEGAGYGLSQTLTGSHNLILGVGNSYSSYGGIVAGQFNSISASYASVTGGQYNTVSSIFSSISGGAYNTININGEYSAITGGASNTAGGLFSSVTGGEGNIANGFYSSISGGGGVFDPTTHQTIGITENNDYSWAAGGSGGGTFHAP